MEWYVDILYFLTYLNCAKSMSVNLYLEEVSMEAQLVQLFLHSHSSIIWLYFYFSMVLIDIFSSLPFLVDDPIFPEKLRNSCLI